MNRYEYPYDGKLHVRYSELTRCTPKQIDRVVFERTNEVSGFQSDHMLDGIDRHEMWASESEVTGYTPEVFKRELGIYLPVSHIEYQLASEIFPGVVLHSTVDAVSVAAATIIDYKTITGDAKAYAASKQLKLYSYQLALHNIRVKEGMFLVEIWETDGDGKRIRIAGYDSIRMPISLLDMDSARQWALPRVALLKTVLAGAIQPKNPRFV